MKTPVEPPDVDELLKAELLKTDSVSDLLPQLMGDDVSPAPDGKYRHWDTLRHLDPPDGLTSETWWISIKHARRSLYQAMPLTDKEGANFQYAPLPSLQETLHTIDRDASGNIEISEQVTNPDTRDRYVINSLIEESTTSSQLEGAATTLERAKEMIRSGDEPTDKSEQMILNNFQAMRFVQDHQDESLTPEFVFRLHRIVTEDTLDEPDSAGEFRDPDDDVVVRGAPNQVLHVPPDAEELDERLEALCQFANGETPERFLHPVIRAIIIHFWVGYDHYFVDGNGRTARALFYWSMLSEGYWLAQYLSISRILRGAPAEYARSFLRTETDENDLTYFLIYHSDVIRRAIDDLHEYLKRKAEEVQEVERLMRRSADFNHRQLALLSHALKHPGGRYTIKSHRRSHDVVYETARSDLSELVDLGLLSRRKRGRQYVFIRPSDLEDRLRDLEG